MFATPACPTAPRLATTNSHQLGRMGSMTAVISRRKQTSLLQALRHRLGIPSTLIRRRSMTLLPEILCIETAAEASKTRARSTLSTGRIGSCVRPRVLKILQYPREDCRRGRAPWEPPTTHRLRRRRARPAAVSPALTADAGNGLPFSLNCGKYLRLLSALPVNKKLTANQTPRPMPPASRDPQAPLQSVSQILFLSERLSSAYEEQDTSAPNGRVPTAFEQHRPDDAASGKPGPSLSC